MGGGRGGERRGGGSACGAGSRLRNSVRTGRGLGRLDGSGIVKGTGLG